MNPIIPAILPKSQNELDEKVSSLLGIVEMVQVDVCDGIFVQNKSEFQNLPFADKMNYELDLMISLVSPVQLDGYIAMRPKSIVLHIESIIENPVIYFDQIKSQGIAVGLASSNTVSAHDIELYLPYVDFVQCMGIAHSGFQGQPFDEMVLNKITELRKLHPSLIISVDGAVNENTISSLRDAGANRFIVGSAVFVGNSVTNIEKLKSLIQ